MSAQDNATTLGKSNQNLVLETAGRIYVKVQDRFYELDFRNQGRGSGDTKIEIINNSTSNQDIDMKGYVTKEFLKASLNSYVTKRSWNDVKETQSMLENAMLDGFTESINPITIQTMQVVVGSDQLQFEFVNDFTHAEEIAYGPNIYKNSIEFNDPGNGIYIKHYTLDGPTEVRPEDIENSEQLKMQYCRWRIAPNRFDLGDPSASYYIYIKVPRLQDNGSWINSSNPMTIYTKTNAESTNVYSQFGLGEFVLSNTAIEMASESDYYYLLYGMINSDDGNGRSFSTMNGFTEILPGQITAYIFKSASGDSYLDLRKNELILGDAFQWNKNNSHILYIKGAIVVDDGGNQSYMYLDRGIFRRYRYDDNGNWIETNICDSDPNIEGNVYYQGNTVVWTNDKGITSTYMYIGPNEDSNHQPIHAYKTNTCDPDPVASEDPNYDPTATYFDPTNENFWRVIAKGVRGYSNLIADLSNEMEAIACDKDGYVINEDGLTVVTQAGLFYGSSDVQLHYTESGGTVTFDGITIDLSEINNVNKSTPTGEPPAITDPQITYTITDTDPASYEKIITFNIPYKLKLPEQAEIPITLTSLNNYGEEDDNTKTIVFTLVGVRSGKAYSLVPSTRTIRRTPNGLYNPIFLTCDAVCNGSNENIVADEIKIKCVENDTIEVNNVEVNIDTYIATNLLNFINDSTYDWDTSLDSYDFTQDAAPEKITFFLYYRDPLAPIATPRWILCDMETILVVKDGDPGKDLSLTTSSQVFMYETESSRVPNNSQITLTAVTQNTTVTNYLWEYCVPGGQWTTITETINNEVVSYNHDNLTVLGPIINNNVVNPRDFTTYFPNDSRMCQFRVTVSYQELGTSKTLTDLTSLHIIKGGDGGLTVYLTNPSMIFSSTEKKGVTFNLAERTEVVGYYGINKLLREDPISNNCDISATITKYICIDVDDVKYEYSNESSIEGAIYKNTVAYYENNNNIPNAVTATTEYQYYNISDYTVNPYGKLYITVNTGSGTSSTPFQINHNNTNNLVKAGEIYINVTIKFGDNQTETLERIIYWSTAQQGEIGIAKQPRGRSDWSINGYPNGNGYEMYQGTQDTEDNWEGLTVSPGQAWVETHNIFFDIVRIPGDPDLTYYCIKGGPGAASHKPGVTSGWETYWTLMTYANIASDVAYINTALIDKIVSKITKVEQLFTGNTTSDEGNLANRIVITGTTADFYNSNADILTSITTSSGSFDNTSPATQSDTTISTSYTGSNNNSHFEVQTYSFSVSGDNCTVTIPSTSIRIRRTDSYNFQNMMITVELRRSNDIIELGTYQSVSSLLSIHEYYLSSITRKLSKTNSGSSWRLYIIFDYDVIEANPSIEYTITFGSNKISYSYPGQYTNGNMLANDGMKSIWNNNGFICTNAGLKKMVNTNLYDVVASSNIQMIYVQQGDGNTTLSNDGLYFLYS